MSNKPVCPTRVRSICHEGNAREERAHFGVSSASVDMTSTAVGPSWSWTPSLSSIQSKSSSNSVSSDQHSSSASPKKKVPLINFWFPRRLCIADFSIVLAQHKGEGRKKAFHQLAPTISKSNETAIDGTRLYNFFFPFFLVQSRDTQTGLIFPIGSASYHPCVKRLGQQLTCVSIIGRWENNASLSAARLRGDRYPFWLLCILALFCGYAVWIFAPGGIRLTSPSPSRTETRRKRNSLIVNYQWRHFFAIFPPASFYAIGH